MPSAPGPAARPPEFDRRLFVSQVRTVENGWIDYNGHLNMAFYNVLFDRGVDDAFETFGLGPAYVKTAEASFFTVEAHLTYLGEIGGGDETVATFRILDHDAKRIHSFQELWRIPDGLLSATSEQMSLHVDMAKKRSAPFPDAVRHRIAAMADRQAGLPRPEQAGHVIGIRRK